MSESAPNWPEYGIGGDHAGARRSRRAFRYCVAACLFFTMVLWYAEGYKRYDKSETQYRMALTLPADSARAILRNVVKRESERNEAPAAKYVYALASIEEADLVLPRYEQAYKLNPNDSFFILDYGCQLFLRTQYKEARERFREAGIQPPKNALPDYLEAAALAVNIPKDGDMSEALALVARTNNSGESILFPRPLWHASLPEHGQAYAEIRREMVRRCTAPLYRFEHAVTGRAEQDIEAGRMRDWDSWLAILQVLGERLAGDARTDKASLGVTQAIAGVQFQLDAVQLRQRMREVAQVAPDAALIERRVRLNEALDLLKDFESTRSARIEAHWQALKHPLILCAESLALLLGLYAASYLFSKLFRAGRTAWSLAHSRWCRGSLVVGFSLLLLLLFCFMAMNDTRPAPRTWMLSATALWYGVLAYLAGFGVLYPVLSLPGAHRVLCNASPNEISSLLPVARRVRRIACISLMRRYYGILLGLFACVLCVWVLGYRLSESLYPTQLELLVTGLDVEELHVVQHVHRLLAQVPQALSQAKEAGL